MMPVTAVTKEDDSTGACARPKTEDTSAYFQRSNVALVGLYTREQERYWVYENAALMARALGHLLGAKIDGDQNQRCAGPYSVMSETVRKHAQPLARMSACSVKQISKLVKNDKFSCMAPIQSICGDGNRQPFEACDCGRANYCQQVQSCCKPDSCILDSSKKNCFSYFDDLFSGFGLGKI